MQGALVGLGPVVIALILSAAWSMGRKKMRSVVGAAIAAATCLAGVLHLNPLWMQSVAGLAGLALKLGPGQAQKPAEP